MAEEKALNSSSPDQSPVVSEEKSVPMASGEGENEKTVTLKSSSPVKVAVVGKELSDDGGEKKKAITQIVSFKEETNVVSDLPNSQKLALDELKTLLREAINNHHFTPSPKSEEIHVKSDHSIQPQIQLQQSSKSEEIPVKSDQSIPHQIPKSEESPVRSDQSIPPQIQSEQSQPKEENPSADSAEPEEDGAKTVEAIEETVVAAKESVPIPTEESSLNPEEISIWGVPLLLDERSDAVLLKFLRARDFKAKEALSMIKSVVQWRKDFNIEGLLEEDVGENDFSKAVFMSGLDKEGHPVCYNVFGAFQDKELYQKAFSDKEKRDGFIRWRIRLLEKNIRTLDYSPTGICTMVQINDLKNSPGPAKKESRLATNQAVSILQDNYPEFVARQVFINIPWWYVAYNTVISPFMTHRTKSKFVFASQAKTASTLFRYIAPEQVPVQYGGLKRDDEHEFSISDSVTEFVIKPSSKHSVEVPVSEDASALWELRVLGWEVSYGSEFVPSAEDGYTVIVQKMRKVGSTEESVICGSFKSGEPGKVVFTIDNQSSRKKKLLYRTKIKSSLIQV